MFVVMDAVVRMKWNGMCVVMCMLLWLAKKKENCELFGMKLGANPSSVTVL